jgi:hypothetical protein
MNHDMDHEFEAMLADPERIAHARRALTDDRLRWKYSVTRHRSHELITDILNLYGTLGWEIASTSEVLETDQWNNTCYYTRIIFKMPWYHVQEDDLDGQS